MMFTLHNGNGSRAVRHYWNMAGLKLVGDAPDAHSQRLRITFAEVAEARLVTVDDWLNWMDHMLDEAEARVAGRPEPA